MKGLTGMRRAIFVVTMLGCAAAGHPTGCSPSVSPGRPPSPRPVVSASAVPPVTTTRVPWRLAANGFDLCVFREGDARCLDRIELRESEPGARLIPESDAVEVRGACRRHVDGRVTCRGVLRAERIASLEGFPYALRHDGTVVLVDEEEDHESERDGRAKVVASLRHVRKVATTSHASCVLFEAGTVSCWVEPESFSFGGKAGPIHVRPVPGVTQAVDLTLESWLHLCVRDEHGDVRCSARPPEPVDVCVMHGAGARCGRAGTHETPHAQLRGRGFDPAGLLARPLTEEPVVRGASSLLAFEHRAYEFAEMSEQISLSESDPGGCAQRADGVWCWNRSSCNASGRFDASQVQDLPPTARLAATTADWGYALDRDRLYAFPRRDDDATNAGDDSACADPATHRPPTLHAALWIPQGVRGVAGGLVPTGALPGYTPLDCASTEAATVVCWSARPGALGERFVLALPR